MVEPNTDIFDKGAQPQPINDELTRFLEMSERFLMEPIKLPQEEDTYITNTARTLLTKNLTPRKWVNVQAHHLSNVISDHQILSGIRADFFPEVLSLNAIKDNPQLTRKLSVFFAARNARGFRAERNANQSSANLQYLSDVIGESVPDLGAFMLKNTVTTMGYLTIAEDEWLTIDSEHDAICASTHGATDEKPYGEHCDPSTEFAVRINLEEITLEGVAPEDNVNDRNQAYLLALRDLCADGEFSQNLEEVKLGTEYKMQGKLLFDKWFLLRVDQTAGKYLYMLQQKMAIKDGQQN